MLSDEELRAEIKSKDEIEPLLRDLLRLIEGLHARVGADDVDFAEMLHAFVKEARDFGDFGHVGLDGEGVGAEGVDLRADAVGAVEAFDVVDDDGGAAGAEFEGDAGADSARGAGYEGDFAGEGGEGVGGLGWRGRRVAVCGVAVGVCCVAVGGFGRGGAVHGGFGHGGCFGARGGVGGFGCCGFWESAV